MSINATEMLERGVSIAKEAIVSTGQAVDGRAYFWYVGEGMPYVTARLGQITVDQDGEDLDSYSYLMTLRIVVGHAGEDYDGALEIWLSNTIPILIQYLNQRELLQSVTYPIALDDLDFARVVGCTGYMHFLNSAIGSVVQIGTEITVRADFREEIVQVYL